MAWLYIRDDLEDASPGQSVDLTGDDVKHAVSVARVRVGERITIGNGRGLCVTGTVLEVRSDRVVVSASEVEHHAQSQPSVTLVQALAKTDRAELAVQASTELGVDTIVPWAARRSVVRWDGAKAIRGRERWQRIAREATKQSVRPWVPAVTELATTSDIVSRARDHHVLILEPTASLSVTEVVFDSRGVVLVVGPEGGITAEESAALQQAGACSVRLGATVLRTSTAGPAALAALAILLKRW